MGLAMSVEASARDYLVELHRLNLRRNNALRQQALRVIAALNGIGLRPLLFKGGAQLFEPIHRNLGNRIMSDLDILVPDNRCNAALEALLGMGYQSTEAPYATPDFHHIAPLVKIGEYGEIELHRQPMHAVTRGVLPAEHIWASARKMTAEGVDFYVPSASHGLLIGMLHSQVDDRHYELRQFDLRNLYDFAAISRYSEKDIDWHLIQRLMAEKGLKHVLESQLLAAHRLLGQKSPAGIAPAPKARAHYFVCLSAVRSAFVERCQRKAGEFSAARIGKRYGCSRKPVPIAAYRMRYLLSVIKRRWQGSPNVKFSEGFQAVRSRQLPSQADRIRI